MNISVCNGKYTIIQDERGLQALRYGDEWRDLTGDGMVLALAQEIEELRSSQHALSNAYLRLRCMIPGALKTPHAPTAEQVWEATEKALLAMERDAQSMRDMVELLTSEDAEHHGDAT